MQAGIDELVRKQRVVGIVEARLELERAGGDVDLVVQRFQLAGGDAAGIGPVIGLHGQRVAGRQLGPHFGQLGLGQREHHGDGLGLGDDHQAIGVGTGHQVALVHLAQAETATDGRGDARVVQLQLGIVDIGLVALDRAFVLAHQRGLRVDLLFGDGVLLVQGLVALQVAAGVFQLGQILHLGALGLGQRDLEGARIDLCQQVAGLTIWPSLKGTSTSSPLTRLRTVTVL